MTHDELCQRAAAFLRSRERCDLVFTRGASCREVPDAIGWSSDGSVVIECKTSVSDFLADREKYRGWKHPEYKWTLSGIRESRRPRKSMLEAGYEEVELPSMGAKRYFMCEAGLLSPEQVKERHPDHGLILIVGRSSKIVLPAPERANPNFSSETRYLRMRLLHIRSNLLGLGASINFDEATLWKGAGITFPAERTR